MNPFNWFRRTPGQASDALCNPVEARVVRCSDAYYLQLKTLAGTWVFGCGYHRGAPGYYNYQFETASNPWALVDHSLPEIQKELDNPTLPIPTIRQAQKLKARDPARIDEMFDVEVLRADPYRPWHRKIDNTRLNELLQQMKDQGGSTPAPGA